MVEFSSSCCTTGDHCPSYLFGLNEDIRQGRHQAMPAADLGYPEGAVAFRGEGDVNDWLVVYLPL